MELWIRSQDKTKLVKIDNISYMDMSENMNQEEHSLWNDCKGILGIYKTKKRALEVLDEIQEKIKNICKFQLVNEDYECDDCVYEMPEE